MSYIYGLNFLENNVNKWLDESRKAYPRGHVTLTLNKKPKKPQSHYPSITVKFKVDPEE